LRDIYTKIQRRIKGNEIKNLETWGAARITVSEEAFKKYSFPTTPNYQFLVILQEILTLKKLTTKMPDFLNKMITHNASKVSFKFYCISIFPVRIFFSLEKNKKIRYEEIKKYTNEFFKKVLDNSNTIASEIIENMQNINEKDEEFLKKHKKEINIINPKVAHFYQITAKFNDFYITFEILMDRLKPSKELLKNLIKDISKKILLKTDNLSEKIMGHLIKNT
jgi:hypothetical protein